MNEHTPGPWKQENNPLNIVNYNAPKGHPVDIARANCPDLDRLWDAATANARLIAASPDLLAACEEALRFTANVEHDQPVLRRQLKAAIAKARGEA